MIVYKYDTETKEFIQELEINEAYGTNLPFTTTVKPLAKKENGIYILNPSSISLPKEGTNSYGIYENDCFTIKTFDNEIVKQIQLD